MFKRITTLLAMVLAVLMAVGVAQAVVAPVGSVDSSEGEPTTSTTQALDGTETIVYEVRDAGTVTVQFDGTSLTITAAEAAEGWAVEVEIASGREVEADFRNATHRVRFEAELEDGEVRARIRIREHGGDSGTTTTTTMPETTSPSPFISTSPRRSSGPRCTSATCRSSTGVWLSMSTATGICCRSSMDSR